MPSPRCSSILVTECLQELTNLLVSLGRLRFAPEDAWMDLFWDVSYHRLSKFRWATYYRMIKRLKLKQAIEEKG